MIVEDIVRTLSKPSASRGILAVGCRRSGKSALAPTLQEALPKAVWLAAGSLLKVQTRNIESSLANVDAEIEAVIALAPPLWIVDDAEILIAYASDLALAQLALAVANGDLRVVLIRNRYLLESDGWFARRERSLTRHLQRVDLLPLQGRDALAAAAHYTANATESERGWRNDWLVEWSGGLHGLMFDLAPVAPTEADITRPPRGFDRLAEKFGRELRLDQGRRVRVLQLAQVGCLPPVTVLHEETAADVGYLCAAGVLAPHYFGRAITKAFQGRLWLEVVRRLVPPPSETMNARNCQTALALSVAAEQAGLVADLCRGIGYEDAEIGLPAMIECWLNCCDIEPRACKSVPQYLADILGRAGIDEMLYQIGLKLEPDTSTIAAAERLVERLAKEAL